MKYQDMSKRTKEECATQLLKFSYNLLFAFIITIFIAPLSVILAHISAGDSNNTPWLQIGNAIASWQGAAFLVLEAVVCYLSLYTRDKACKIYNSLYPDE